MAACRDTAARHLLLKDTAHAPQRIAHRRPAFSPDPRPHSGARSHPAGDGPAGDRPPRARIPEARPTRAGGHQDDLQLRRAGDHLYRDRHRRVGSGPREHALARRSRADGRDRAVRHAVEEHGGETRAAAGIHQDRLAHWRRSDGNRGPSAPGQEQGNQSSLRAAQRDLDRLPVADCGDSQGDRRRRPPRTVLSIPSPRSPPPITGTTNGASTSPSAARRRA